MSQQDTFYIEEAEALKQENKKPEQKEGEGQGDIKELMNNEFLKDIADDMGIDLDEDEEKKKEDEKKDEDKKDDK